MGTVLLQAESYPGPLLRLLKQAVKNSPGPQQGSASWLTSAHTGTPKNKGVGR